MKEYYAQFSWFSMGRMTRSTFNDNKEQTDTLRRIGDVVATDAIERIRSNHMKLPTIAFIYLSIHYQDTIE